MPMELTKQQLISFIDLYAPLKVGESTGDSQSKVKDYSRYSCSGLSVQASVGMGRATGIPWLACVGYGQKVTNGIYPVLLFYKEHDLVVVAYGISASNQPTNKWLVSGKTLNEFFKSQSIKLSPSEKKYGSSIYHSHFTIPMSSGKLDSALFESDKVLAALNDVCEVYNKQFGTMSMKKDSHNIKKNSSASSASFDVAKLYEHIEKTGLFYDRQLISRFCAALLTKPFVILSGLSGSGKTQLALAIAHALSGCIDDKDKGQVCFVAVGADWTNREPLLGYPNALKKDEYVRPENGVLDIIIRAEKDEKNPYFLILDEMNLSYVERYFADFLSSMESDKKIALWTTDGKAVPMSVSLPNNLFIIGTINVDETTYMFSPKVLDRANVIEFKISETEMSEYLSSIRKVDLSMVDGKASDMAESFVALANNKDFEIDESVQDTLLSFFKELKRVNAEFGYRSASEIYRYIGKAKSQGMTVQGAIDSAVVQKLLPKLHGSRKRIAPVLLKMWSFCTANGNDSALEEDYTQEINKDEFIYPLSADKIRRMYAAAIDNGFTSFAEA